MSSVDVVAAGVSVRRSGPRAMSHGTSCTGKVRELFRLHGNTCGKSWGEKNRMMILFFLFPFRHRNFGA